MPTLPLLKTGAVTQYPAVNTIRFSSHVIRFVDGLEQRYRDFPSPLRSWVIRLDLLDETEMKAMEEFFASRKGQSGSFTFVDPQSQTTFPDCSLAGDDFEFELEGEMRGKTTLIVRENRSQP